MKNKIVRFFWTTLYNGKQGKTKIKKSGADTAKTCSKFKNFRILIQVHFRQNHQIS